MCNVEMKTLDGLDMEISSTKAYYYGCCIALVQVSRFSFQEMKIPELEWGSHISSVSKLVGRKGIQVLALGAHYIISNFLLWNTPGSDHIIVALG